MLFEHRYAGSSGVAQGDASTSMSFAPDTLRPPTFFRGNVIKQVEFREAISALHDVVTSDLRFIPKDRRDYLTWREQQSYLDLAAITGDQARISAEIKTLQEELAVLEAAGAARRKLFYDQRQKYFSYLYNRDKELWFKLDPVITVHPDQVFFECFSKDESSYGRLAASYEVFQELGDRANGTTNIDYSEKLYGEFQKIRSYKTTALEIDPSGFDVKTSMEDTYREVKIDLPDTWVRGFLQVSSAATLPAHVVEFHPMDVHNLCLILRRNKELFGPRSIRFQLTPGAPVTLVVDPWGTKLSCPRSRYLDSRAGTKGDTEIRIWGRRRLYILERLLPRAKRVRCFLLGTGLPTYWVVDLGDLSFTLGLSGWTNNNWSDAGNFDLMAAREEVDTVTQKRVFDELGKTWLATPEELAQRTGLATPIVASALAGWVQAGRAIFDLDKGVYRKRELTRDPLPMDKLRFSNPREEAAGKMVTRGKIAVDGAEGTDGGLVLWGRVKDGQKTFAPKMTFDAEQRLVQGECTCDYYIRNKLHRGPCEHMLALRAAHRRGINDTIEFKPVTTNKVFGITTSQQSDTSRDNFQAAFRKAVTRAAELRAQGRRDDSIIELERVARLAPPNSNELGRLHEVIAEAKYEAEDDDGALASAAIALDKFPTSSLALRVKRDALVRSGLISTAIPVARNLCTIENTGDRWNELVTLCHRIEDWKAMLELADEGLHHHPKHAGLQAARDIARQHAGSSKSSTTATATPTADDTSKQSWWRRAINKVTGKQTPVVVSLDTELLAVVNELALRARIVDRDTLTQVLRVAHASADNKEARVIAMVTALKGTYAIRDLPSDQDLLALLRSNIS
jgi:tetratricopeptide (TPR) repeat protein